MEIFGIPHQAFLGQLLLGLVNGAFYALLSLGLAVIFGLLGIVNFAHGALYMLGAFAAWIMLDQFGISYWWALLLAPLSVGVLGVVIERLFLKHLYKLDPLYGLLLTFGLALIAEGIFRELYGVSGQPYNVPELLSGATNLGFMVLPNYRAWVVFASLIVCFGTWFLIERTRLGSYLRAGTENPRLVQAFGVNVPLMITLTYGFGVALAAFAGVLAAPIFSVGPLMGADLIIVREPPDLLKIPEMERFSSLQLVENLKAQGLWAFYFSDTEAILDFLRGELRGGDVVLIMSNGGFDRIHERLLAGLEKLETMKSDGRKLTDQSS